MDFGTASNLANAATVIEAREWLTQMKIADFPHLKKEARQKLHKEISKIAYPPVEGGKAMSLQEAAKKLAMHKLGKGQ